MLKNHYISPGNSVVKLVYLCIARGIDIYIPELKLKIHSFVTLTCFNCSKAPCSYWPAHRSAQGPPPSPQEALWNGAALENRHESRVSGWVGRHSVHCTRCYRLFSNGWIHWPAHGHIAPAPLKHVVFSDFYFSNPMGMKRSVSLI